MTANNCPLSEDQSQHPPGTEAFYEIRVKGRLDPSWSDWLDGLAITPQPEGETLLAGPIVDQAALHSILDKLYAMNLTIHSVIQVKKDREIEDDNV